MWLVDVATEVNHRLSYMWKGCKLEACKGGSNPPAYITGRLRSGFFDWRWCAIKERQRRFADEYIISGNAYQSAIKAGYSEKYAKARSSELLENVGIKNYIEERLEELQEKKIAKQAEVLEYLTAVMRGEETEQTLKNVGEFGQEIVDIGVGAKDRIKAAELLGKRYRMWTDKVEAEVSATVNFIGADDVRD